MSEIISNLTQLLAARRNADPESSYVAGLHHAGLNKILEKVGEEATETIIAAKDTDGDATNVVYETADLWFHTMVMLSHVGATPQDVLTELERRFGTSGLTEKASRTSSDAV